MPRMPLAAGLAIVPALVVAAPATAAIGVRSESQLRAAWADPGVRHIELRHDLVLSQCGRGDPLRNAARPVTVDGRGHVVRQTCPETRLLRQDGTGLVRLRDITLTNGSADGPGGAVATRGAIHVAGSRIVRSRSEDPGGGVFSAWGATIVRSTITGNLANDDGGGVYARRGGIRVFDSVIGSNIVDGSGGALASTGNILVVRSHVDGNTTDGDGGGIYADGAADVTVIDSTVDGSTADGPGGGIFTVAGDVTVVNSTVNGNRADDRGGGIAGEGRVVVINSTISRNSANAHVAGGIWARGDLHVANSTISSNYAEGEGGGLLGAGVVRLAGATVTDNTAPLAANVAAGAHLESFASIIGPAEIRPTGGVAQPSARNCRAPSVRSLGWNVVSDTTCDLVAPTDLGGTDPQLGAPTTAGRPGETRPPLPTSPAVGLVPRAVCTTAALMDVVRWARHLDGVIADPATLVATDQDGVPRGADGGACTAGAVEVPRQVALLAATVARYEQWSSCLRVVTTREHGDPLGRTGYRFEARDGTGVVYRTGLALAPGAAAGDDVHDFLHLRADGTCVPLRSLDTGRAGRGSLRATVRRIARAVRRFDAWESCLTTVGVSEHGDQHGGFGYQFGSSARPRTWRAALSIDRTDPEDPDYLLLAQRHDGTCADDDADTEADDDLGERRHGLADAVADLVEPVADMARFDRCMFTVGVVQRGASDAAGYRFGPGGRRSMPALSLAIRGGRASHQLLAFAPEEPPGIECDEDDAEDDDD